MEFKVVHINKIDDSFRFCYHHDLKDPLLTQSIKVKGILQPLCLLNKIKYQIIDGHRRFTLAKEFNAQEIPAVLFEPNQLKEKFFETIHLDFVSNQLSVIEKLKAVSIADREFGPHLAIEVAHIFNMGKVFNIIEISHKINQYPEWLKKYFHQINIQLKILTKVLDYSLEKYREWFKVSQLISLKGTEFLTLLEQIREICLRDEVQPSHLIEALQVKDMVDGNRTPQQKSQKIKEIVTLRRFPLLNGIRKNIEKSSSKIKKIFGNNVELIWDKYLEKPGIILRLKLDNKSDLELLYKKFRDKNIQEELRKIIEKIEQLPD
jgi:hypothetical protein